MSIPYEIKTYLKKYYIPGWELECTPGNVNIAVVIPAIQEYENIQRLFNSIVSVDTELLSTTLWIFVINNSASASDEVRVDNNKSLEFLREQIAANKNVHIGVVDASSSGKELDVKTAGVGLARKIGMDLALHLFDYANPSKIILVCLDADCLISSNYLSGIKRAFDDSAEAASIYFEHPLPLSDAIISYEIFLRYYVQSLKYAGSPYAFHTIGSSMACTPGAYIKIGGMNKKKAAEDFYFLEKLSKVTTIRNINDVVVYPSSRTSWRVPFGTGQRVTRYHAKTHNEYLLYNPDSFEILKGWLLLLDELPGSSPGAILKRAFVISPHLGKFLEENDFIGTWENIFRTATSQSQLKKQTRFWFDGFRTLKFIHYLRDQAYGDCLMFYTLNILFKKLNLTFDSWLSHNIPPYDKQVEYLLQLRTLDRTGQK